MSDATPASEQAPGESSARGTTSPDLATPAVSAVTLEAVSCPACEAVLKNVRVEPGATLRCLNCGKRFRPQIAGDSAEIPTGDHGHSAPLREPGGVGYWLLRVPSILIFAIGSLGAALILAFNIRYFYGRFEEMVLWSYLPLMPWVGCFLFLVSRAMSRVDVSSVRIAWKSGAQQTALPSVPGSSLPYVAPIAIAGGALPVICLRAEPDSIEAALIGTLIGGALFYIGFAFEDLRQFIWRQETLARSFCRNAGVDTQTMEPSGGIPWSALFLAGVTAFFGLGLLLVSIAQLMWQLRWRNVLIPMYAGCGLMAVSYSLYRINRDWERAIAWWQLARWAVRAKASGENAADMIQRNNVKWELGIWPELVASDLPPWLLLARRVPQAWLAWGVLWVCYMFIKEGLPHRVVEALGVFSLCFGGGSLALWLSQYLPQLARWRGAREEVLRRCGATSASVPRLGNAALWWVLSAAALEAFLLGALLVNQWSRWGRVRFEEIAAFPLLMLMCHFPQVWLGLLMQQLLLAESTGASDAQEKD